MAGQFPIRPIIAVDTLSNVYAVASPVLRSQCGSLYNASSEAAELVRNLLAGGKTVFRYARVNAPFPTIGMVRSSDLLTDGLTRARPPTRCLHGNGSTPGR